MDHSGFERAYARHAVAVRCYVARRVGPGDVDDALADVWLVAWRRRDDLPVEPLPWLYGTARRVLANQRRGRGRLQALSERLGSAALTARDPIDLPDAELGAALGRLSSNDREALLLIAWEGLTA